MLRSQVRKTNHFLRKNDNRSFYLKKTFFFFEEANDFLLTPKGSENPGGGFSPRRVHLTSLLESYGVTVR